jgi:hypothetical protein
VAELTPASQELASLQIREADACQHANEAKEKLVALAKRACADTVVTERLWKEPNELLLAIEELRIERDLACQERADAHQ